MIMRNRAKLTIIIAALVTMIFAIKPYYGGEVTIRLNEPANFCSLPLPIIPTWYFIRSSIEKFFFILKG